MFSYQICQLVGSYFVSLGGADVIIFTAGMGEHSPFLRKNICEGLKALGVEADDNLNENSQNVFSFHKETSRIQLWKVSTDEELDIARQTKECISKAKPHSSL